MNGNGSMLEHALWALKRDFRVFPLQMGGKKPNGFAAPNGVRDSTTDEAQVREWWKEHPNGNVGIHGGTIVDCDKGINSLAEAEAWREKVGLPPTLAVRTGRRSSYGVQFHYTGQTKTGPDEFHGVSGEVRSGNTYGIAPGSIHPDTGKPYELVIDLPRAAYPPDNAIEKSKTKIVKKLAKDPKALKPGEKIKPSFRQYWLVSQCGRLRRTGLDGEALFDALRALCDKYCENPEEKTDEMLRQICESGEKYGVTTPATWKEELEEFIEKFNEKFYVVEDYGGKCHVAWEEPSTAFPGAIHFGHQSFSEFTKRFWCKSIQVGDEDGEPKCETLGKAWLVSPRHRQYKKVVFAPGQTLRPEVRNLWQGFAFSPQQGDWSLLREHIREIVCDGDEEKYNWLVRWMAYGTRHPNEPGHTCMVFLGEEGTGKNTVAAAYAKLWGAHAITVTQSEHVTGRFNSHLRAKCCVILNEAFYAGDRSHAGVLKALITDPTISIEQKGVDVEEFPNLLRVIIISNNDWAIPAGINARRFTVFHISDNRRNDTAYFRKIQEQLDNGGYEAFLHDLLTMDISDFEPRIMLATDELNEQKALSLCGVEDVWYECLQRGCLPGTLRDDGSAVLRASDLVDWANKKYRRGWDNLKSEHVGHTFGATTRAKKKGMGFEKARADVFDEGRVRVFVIPPLNEARQRWNETRFKADWGDDGEWKVDKDWTEEQNIKAWTGGQNVKSMGGRRR